jgi:subtilisin family serine protease
VPTPISQFAFHSATELYLGFFGRAPDASGLYYWSKQISQGTSPIDVAKGFANSTEFIQKYGSLNAGAKIDLAYQNILNRLPDGGGHDFWTQRLESGTPIGDIIWSIVDAAFNQHGSVDGLLVQSKVANASAIFAPAILDTPLSTWNSSAGYGVINVASALSSVLGLTVKQGTSFNSSIEQWPITVSHFQDAWAAGATGKGVVVAVIDTGIDLGNSAINHDINPWSWNFVSNNANVQDDNGHGSAVISQINSRPSASNPKALYGGAYDSEVMVLKALGADGKGTQKNLVAAINYAVEHGAKVINLSVGGNFNDAATLAALTNAADRGVIVCMAAGNGGVTAPQYPAQFAKTINTTIAVGSVAQNADGSIAWASSTNAAGSITPYNYIDAPGAKVLAYGLNSVVQNWTGTSFATPYVSAAAANLLSVNSGLGGEQIVNALVNTSVDLVGVPTVVV